MTKNNTATPNTSVVLDQKKIAELQKTGPRMLDQAKDAEIANNDDFLSAGSLLELVVRRQREVAEFFRQPAEDANRLHKFITNLRTALLRPLQDAEQLLKARRADYRRKSEAEDRAREEAERARAKQEADNRAIEEAAQLKAIGEHEAADIVLTRAAAAPPPPVAVQSSLPKEKGKSIKHSWAFRVKNQSLVKPEFLMPDEKKINAIVSRLGIDAMNIVGGIEVFEEETEVVRTK